MTTTTGPVDALSAAIEAMRFADWALTGDCFYGLAEGGEIADGVRMPLWTDDLYADLDRILGETDPATPPPTAVAWVGVDRPAVFTRDDRSRVECRVLAEYSDGTAGIRLPDGDEFIVALNRLNVVDGLGR